jgi:hypothetical protein
LKTEYTYHPETLRFVEEIYRDNYLEITEADSGNTVSILFNSSLFKMHQQFMSLCRQNKLKLFKDHQKITENNIQHILGYCRSAYVIPEVFFTFFENYPERIEKFKREISSSFGCSVLMNILKQEGDCSQQLQRYRYIVGEECYQGLMSKRLYNT